MTRRSGSKVQLAFEIQVRVFEVVLVGCFFVDEEEERERENWGRGGRERREEKKRGWVRERKAVRKERRDREWKTH